MVEYIWQVDNDTAVIWQANLSGKQTILVNGITVYQKLSLKMNSVIDFTLPDGRIASIAVKTQRMRPVCELTVNGKLITLNKTCGINRKKSYIESALLLEPNDHQKLREMMIVASSILIVDWTYEVYLSGKVGIPTALGISINIIIIYLALINKFTQNYLGRMFWGTTRYCIPFFLFFNGSRFILALMNKQYHPRMIIDLSAIALCLYYYSVHKKYVNLIKEVQKK